LVAQILLRISCKPAACNLVRVAQEHPHLEAGSKCHWESGGLSHRGPQVLAKAAEAGRPASAARDHATPHLSSGYMKWPCSDGSRVSRARRSAATPSLTGMKDKSRCAADPEPLRHVAVPARRCTTRALTGAAFGYALPALALRRIRDMPPRQQARLTPTAFPTYVSIETIV
jgi:hypothetical protein